MPQTEALNSIANALEKVAEQLEKNAASEKTAQITPQPDYGSLGEASRDRLDPLTRFILE